MKKGDRVETTGAGRTAAWMRAGVTYGTVERATRRAVFVRWQGCSFSDEMDPAEVRAVVEAGRKG
jgi:hypothetical protein